MPSRPIIGITADYDVSHTKHLIARFYTDAVSRAGGVPILLPFSAALDCVPDMLGVCDGVLLCGGDDPDPTRWGEQRHPNTVPLDPDREAFDYAVIAELHRRQLPTLGICLGMQLINVHRGGTLHQFLPDVRREDAVEHRRFNEVGWNNRHDVVVERDSLLHETVGADVISTNSSHKQAVNKLGDGLTVVARTRDGIVEAFEDRSMPLLIGVQWHPERQPGEPTHEKLFDLLVKRAGEFKAKRR